MCEIISFAIVYFFFDDRQQTAWSQGSSKYQKQKKCTCSEISINLSFYVYIIMALFLISLACASIP
jgi:hypothetical protein